MEQLSTEIFNILKGANYKLRLFTVDGKKTLESEEATRFYAYDHDLMITIRKLDGSVEVVVQAGRDYDVPANSDLVQSIKKVAHKNLGEFTVRKFNKNIVPKDFAHQSVQESKAFGKSYGSIKTSYIPSPNSKIIIKHSKRVDEEVRGSRSRNIHSIFIENKQGERFKFPYKYMTGAKAMSKHVSEGGTPYDSIGRSIMEMCGDLSDINKFVRHVKTNKLVNESNEDVIQTVKEAAADIKRSLKKLTTNKGYYGYQPSESKDIGIDLSEKFTYNPLESDDMAGPSSTVARIVAEKNEKKIMEKELLKRLGKLITSDIDLKLSLDPNDPEHPDNEDPIKYSGNEGPLAKLSAHLSHLALKSKNDEASNVFAELATQVHSMDPAHVMLVAKAIAHIGKTASTAPSNESIDTSIGLAESCILGLRRNIS